ncbi:MAG: hypothetical protein RML15_00590 [Bacteroidota bacterium]|nr:hypothetical protein [Candidatus Kapabacteria bacterium]MCS7302391.1 hypothetical protein [Candidatus Kapabacteria bacterium]MCX7937135.1 hypothetical protein [Chlorobiota bacterium]MDW8074628.1 hypothetical protein [Bacteroidota bacterium]MDW8270896.1 hypothetical protein [Bacteroidota bacterium]
MKQRLEQHSFSVSEFLTAAILCIAVVVAAHLWHRGQEVTSVSIEGWEHIAQEYRDSVTCAVNLLLSKKTLPSLRQIEQEVERFPFIRQAMARRIGTVLKITVTEHHPCALVRAADGSVRWVLSDSLIGEYRPYYRQANVPVISIHHLRQLAQALPILRTFSADSRLNTWCAELQCSRDGTLSIILSPTSTAVLLGSNTNLSSKIDRLAWFIESPWYRQNVAVVDLRWQNRIIVSLASQQSTSVGGGV